MRVLRWSPLIVYAILDTIGDADNTLSVLKGAALVASITLLELRDGRAAKRGSLRLVASRCEGHEQVAENQRDIAAVRDTVAALQRAWARIGVTEAPEPSLRLISSGRSDDGGQARASRDTT